jgi:eukaryotic-like serine/threonine-protein kinase
MPLSAGDKLGPYEVIASIGKGGMGEVYRAHDSRTGRDVAVKISAERFNERFDREVRAVAALNHPNICTLFDVGPDYLVMELVEGGSPKGPLPLDEVLRIARQIAAALEAAHEKGIIHRDLKPANIKLTSDGAVKVLDFGLAKMGAAEDSASRSSPEVSPTLSMTATHAGMIMGTAAYMAPEQAKGKAVDKRADIWAFGVVLYELSTGERLFQHDDVTETLAAIVMKTPDLDRVPFEVRRLLKKCLEKDPKRRLRDIGDVWELLDTEPARAIAATPKARPAIIPWAIIAVLLLILVAAAFWIFKPSPPPPITRFAIPLGEGQQITNTGRLDVAISPDGTQIAYVANRRLYLRSMQDREARLIPGAESATGVALPTFSPDGKSLVFWSNAEEVIKQVALSGGAPLVICRDVAPRALTWGSDGIVFAEQNRGILRVSPNGGKPELLVQPKNNEQIQGPQMLPDGQAVLFTVAPGATVSTAAWDQAKIVVQTLKSGVRKTVIEGGTDARYLPTGHLVYALNGVLLAQPFDLRRLEMTGGPVGVVEGIARTPVGGAQFGFSNTGSLIYLPGPVAGTASTGQAALVLVDRKGEVERLKNLPSGVYFTPRVSRDGKRVAYQTNDSKESSIWIYELSGAAAPRRLTLPGTGTNRDPIWSPDGKRIAFQSDREGDLGIFWQLADGTGTAERLTKPEKGISHIPDSWTPDGQTLSFTEVKGNASAVWTYSLRNKKATPLAEVPGFLLGSSVFSPDGRWLAYQELNLPANRRDSSSMIVDRIYVQSFPPSAARYQVPSEGVNHHPLWSPDGKELFYTGGPDIFESVSVTTKPSLSFGSPLRAPKSGFNMVAPQAVRPYDILPDGKRFIGMVSAGQAQPGGGPPQIQVVLNWFEDVKQRAPVK